MRLKIIGGNLIAVLLLGLVSYLVVGARLRGELTEEINSQLGNDQTLLDRSWRLASLEFLRHVADKAAESEVRAVFTGLDEAGRRTRAFEAANEIATWLGDPARGRGGQPDIVAFTDETGKVIARNADRNRMYGANLAAELPALRNVLSGRPAVHDVWNKADEQKIFQTAVAAIRNESGTVLGALVVGYDVSNGLAQREAQILGRDVAFVIDGKVYSSSLPADAVEGLKAHLFGPAVAQTRAALAGQAISPRWDAQLGAAEYVGVTAPLPMSQSVQVAYVVLANKTARMAIASVANIIVVAMVLFIVVVVVYGWVVGSSFERPIEEIEEGVLAVINGRTDLRLDIQSAELGGLAYRINQLLNVFTGVSEAESEDEEGRVSRPPEPAAWKDSAFADQTATIQGAAAGGGANDAIEDSALAAQLAAEAEDAYYARVYSEYVAAKQAIGENVGNIPQDKFAQRLKQNEAALVQKHGCRMVRFQVQSRGNQVILRPVIIR